MVAAYYLITGEQILALFFRPDLERVLAPSSVEWRDVRTSHSFLPSGIAQSLARLNERAEFAKVTLCSENLC
jgi:hypothetical protein